MANGKSVLNGLGKWILSAAGALLLIFLTALANTVYIEDQKTYATKAEVRELKEDLKGDLEYIRDRVDQILMREE